MVIIFSKVRNEDGQLERHSQKARGISKLLGQHLFFERRHVKRNIYRVISKQLLMSKRRVAAFWTMRPR